MRRVASALVAIGLATAGIAGIAGALGSLGATAPTQEVSPPVPGAFEVDIAHSTLNFKVRHFGVANIYGRVNKPMGWFLLNPDDLANSFIQVSVEIRNMDAGNDGRNRFLMGPDFFNAREYPTATFTSSRIEKDGDAYRAVGAFTMHGVEREVVAELRGFTEMQTTKFGYRAGYDAVFTVNRSAFGMSLFVEEGTLGDEVTILAAIEGVQR